MKRAIDSVDGDGSTVLSLSSSSSNDIVVLNVGGTLHSTTRHVLVNSRDWFPDSLLARMFRPNNDSDGGPTVLRDPQGHYFIDAEFRVFRHVLNVLRRPSLVRDVPHDMSAQAWCCELDYWGLVKADDILYPGSSSEHKQRANESDTLESLGLSIRQDIMETEIEVIHTLFSTTGYDRQGGKTRSAMLRVPVGKHTITWPGGRSCDLATYIIKNRDCIEQLLKNMLRLEDANAVSIHESKTATHHITYEFNERQYTTQEATLTITIHYKNLQTLATVRAVTK